MEKSDSGISGWFTNESIAIKEQHGRFGAHCNLRIIFDGVTTAVFTPGHMIAGKVLFTTSGFVEIRSVQLKIKGEASTSWTDFAVDQQNSTSLCIIGTHHRAVKYFANEVFFEKINILIDDGDKLRLNAGEHVYPFEISLPDFLPPTFHDDYGYIKYTAKVTIEIPSGINNQTNEMHFNVFSHYNLNNEPSLVEPKKEEKLKLFNNLFFASGHIKIAVYVPYTGFVPGHIIQLTIELVNASNVAINTVQVKLEKKLTFKANEPQFNSKSRSTVYELLSFQGIEGHASSTWLKEIMIPNDLVVNNLNYCRIIEEIFTLNVVAKGSGVHTNTEVHMNIAMGNIPLTISESPI